MNILVINAGSSSLKYQLIDMVDESIVAKGICERIGQAGSKITYKPTGKENVAKESPMKDHNDAIKLVLDMLVDPSNGVIKDMSEISAVGHRLVHGGEKFTSSALITDEMLHAMEDLTELAPLHNPANLMGVAACRAIMKDTPMVGVFDTAFHQTMPSRAYLYGIPYEAYTDLKIRRYGFHGTSHKYVSELAAERIGKKASEAKIITCHLGNGSSVAAVDGGKSVDTSMGFTPLEGLVMGTRSGTLDPAIVTFLMEKLNLDIHGVNDYLNKKSGVMGLSGISSDFRDLNDAADAGNERAKIAMEVFAYRVKKLIGAYAVAMNGLDAVVFTAGVGENDHVVRELVMKDMEFIGIDADFEKNNNVPRGSEAELTKPGSRVKVFLLPTDEELVIARDTVAVALKK